MVEGRWRRGRLPWLLLAISSAGACGGGGSPVHGGGGGSVGVTVGGKDWELVQGEIVSQGTTMSGQKIWQVILSSQEHDRCSLSLASVLKATTPTAFLTVAVPVKTGAYDLADLGGASITSGGASLDLLASGSLDVVAIDPTTVTLRIQGPETISHRAVSGTFVVDACGFAGQSLFSLQRCDLPPTTVVLGIMPSLQAVSPAGRVALASATDTLSVFARQEDATGGCRYQLDPAYGAGGLVRLPKRFRWTAFDDAERLYVATGLGSQQPGSLFRAAPGAPLVSCRYNETANGRVTDDAPDHMLVLPDGSAVYLRWREYESRLDLTSASLSDRDLACDLVSRDPMGLYYTDAVSADTSGLTFLRDVNARRRAAITDFALIPVRYFGGTPSGLGEQGFMDVTLLSRCSTGYCAASDRALKVFSAEGAFVQMIQLANELGDLARPTFLVQGRKGESYLRVDLGLGADPLDVVYRLSPR